MNTAAELRKQIESALAERIPAALSVRPAATLELVSCGVAEVDAALGGGLPLGGISELTGAASSGRTTLAWATLAGITLEGGSCAYVDVSDSFDPLSASALGVDLRRLLWVRAGATVADSPLSATVPAQPATQDAIQEKAGFGRGGCHPRTEAIGVDRAVSRLFNGRQETIGNPPSEPRDFTPRCSESIRRKRIEPAIFTPQAGLSHGTAFHAQRGTERKPWGRLDRALRATDLLLNAGGFRAVVLDMGDVSPEYARRVPLATWYRFRLQVEKSQTLFLLLTQMACANSCAAVSLHCGEPQAEWRQAAENGPSLLTRMHHGVSILRNRAADARWSAGDRLPHKTSGEQLSLYPDAYRKKPAASSPFAKSARSGDPVAVEVSWSNTTLWSR